MVEPASVCSVCNNKGHKPSKCPELGIPPETGSTPGGQRYDDPDDHDHDDFILLADKAKDAVAV